jgi:hypothetical protein
MTATPPKKKSSIAAGLAAAAAGRGTPRTSPAASNPPKTDKAKLVMIGGMFPPEVRRALLLIQAEPRNQGKNLKMLLGEAINDLCAKYNKPQPYGGELQA